MSDIQYVMQKTPDIGVPTLVAKGIYMLRLPLPFALDHVNVWLLEDDQSWTIIDTGLGSKACLDIWDNVLTSFLSSKPVKQIVLTHYHPDHVGLSGDLVDRTKANVYMSRTEWLMANMLYHDSEGKLETKMLTLFKQHGLPGDLFEQMQIHKTTYRDRCSTLPSGFYRLRHNDSIQIGGVSWQCREGRGHSPEHIALYSTDRRILIAGDHILPKITPNIPMLVQDITANPIVDYIESLKTFKDIGNNVLVLPSHRLPFTGIRHRIEQLISHHHERLNLLLDTCDKPVTIFEVLPVLFKRDLDINQMSFAMLEALSHMVYLEQEGKITRELKDGTYYWDQQK